MNKIENIIINYDFYKTLCKEERDLINDLSYNYILYFLINNKVINLKEVYESINNLTNKNDRLLFCNEIKKEQTLYIDNELELLKQAKKSKLQTCFYKTFRCDYADIYPTFEISNVKNLSIYK